jgi:hypothetical protein
VRAALRLHAALASGLFLFAPVGDARAQNAEDTKKAETLFDEGTRLLNAGRFEEACPRLLSAQSLVPGIGVTLYLAECYEETSRLKGAWDEFKRAEAMAAQKADKRSTVAHDRAERLWPKLTKLKIVVSPSAALPGLVVTDEGVPVERVAWGTERPIDPKVHHLRANAPQRESWQATIDVPATPGTVAVEVPVLREQGQPGGASLNPAEGGATTAQGTPDHPAEGHDGLGPQRVAGIALFGVGVVGVGVGIFTGLYAISKLNDSNSGQPPHCTPADRCDGFGLDERSKGMTAATVSDVGFGVGAAFMVAGAVLYFLPPLGKNKTMALVPQYSRRGASMVLEGRW